MGKRRSFSAQFKAKVALEALVGDQTLAEVFARKTSSRAADHEAEVKALHAKIGQLTVENNFCLAPSAVEPRPKDKDNDDRSGSSPAPYRAPVHLGRPLAIHLLLRGSRGKFLQPAVDAHHRRTVSGHAVVWVPTDGPSPAAPRPWGRAQARAWIDATDGTDGHLPQAADVVAGWVPSELSVSSRPSQDRAAEPGVVRGRDLISRCSEVSFT